MRLLMVGFSIHHMPNPTAGMLCPLLNISARATPFTIITAA
jgi:hypothetical protein